MNYKDVAEGLWQRFKEMVMVRKRLENYVFMPEANPEGEQNSWLAHLSEDEGQLQLLATELTLRAFQLGVEAINYKILVHLKKERTVAISTLADLTGLPELLIGERVNDLAQMGLALRSMENDQVQATLLADSFLEIIEATAEELSNNIQDRLPELIRK
jgi:hypothetical protein